ncbi:MAG: terminase [Shewanella sp.]|nr:terminase [Shewanella sp.]MCF1437198.1 terminase [Shewanella sp.]MCF1459488.1 terminase [Shewanella sp.]
MISNEEEKLQDLIINKCRFDPERYVRTCIEIPDGGEPDKWQAEQLNRVGEAFLADPETVIREATSSGHGIGKSAEVSWVILWAMSTRPHLAGIVTANTDAQLKTKTWRELSVWHKRTINAHWFKWTATKFYHVDHPETWFVSAIPWSETRPESFAGLHAEHVLIVYDEASAIPDAIWEVSEGAMTTPRAMWFCYGNPTRNTGRFRECFGRFKHRWYHTQIDSRTCKMTNKCQLEDWVKDYGEDSDFVRVRVRGEFPRAGSLQFIPSDHVDLARQRNIEHSVYFHMPILLGVDVARFGDDQSVICVRQGRKVVEQTKYRSLNTMQLAARVIEKIRQFKPQCTFIDVIGVGGGVVDQLTEMGYPIIEVNASSTPDDNETYLNKRSEMWGRLRNWLSGEVDIPDDPELADELCGLEYGYTATRFQIQLEKKEDMKGRGLSSPDCADALALTFAEHVAPPEARNDLMMPDDVEMDDIEYAY